MTTKNNDHLSMALDWALDTLKTGEPRSALKSLLSLRRALEAQETVHPTVKAIVQEICEQVAAKM